MKNLLLKLSCAVFALIMALPLLNVYAQNQQASVTNQPMTAKMAYLGKFDAGVPNAGIYKMYDKTDDVVCYILMPDLPITKRIKQGMMYDANSIGSISCVKVKVHVVPIQN